MEIKERLFYVLLTVFCLWLAGFFWLIWQVMQSPDKLDPAMALVAGLGLGLVTEFFLAALLLSWQFWFRKEPSSKELTSTGTS